MKRSLATWQKADPRAMAFEQSPVATMHALADMKADLMMMAELLRKVAMPTPEEFTLTAEDLAVARLAELLRKVAMPTPEEFTLTAEDLAVAVLDKIQPREWHEWEESK